MNEFEKCMRAQDLDALYSDDMRPVLCIEDRLGDPEAKLLWRRVSVINKFLTSIEELDDFFSEKTDDDYMFFLKKISDFINASVSYGRVFFMRKNSQNISEFFGDGMSLAPLLARDSEINMYLPEENMVFLGHDDYGFIAVFTERARGMLVLEEIAALTGLYVVGPHMPHSG